jgi:hypothetical protein
MNGLRMLAERVVGSPSSARTYDLRITGLLARRSTPFCVSDAILRHYALQNVRFRPLPDIRPRAWRLELGAANQFLGVRLGRGRIHSITRFARSNNEGGIETPNSLATFWFTVSSKRAGCMIGSSAGFAPLAILSRYKAIPWAASSRLSP